MSNVDATKDETLATLLTMNAGMAEFEMAQEKWAECENAIAVKTNVTPTTTTLRRKRLLLTPAQIGTAMKEKSRVRDGGRDGGRDGLRRRFRSERVFVVIEVFIEEVFLLFLLL